MPYSREFLICAFLSRYMSLPYEDFVAVADIAEKTYDMYGRDKFRVYSGLDAAAIKQYKEHFVL